jgi:hypothetical protein
MEIPQQLDLIPRKAQIAARSFFLHFHPFLKVNFQERMEM